MTVMKSSQEKVLISELQEGSPVESVFLCSHKALLKDKNGKPYINLKLMDRSGEVEARVWEKAPLFSEGFNKFDYVLIKANVVAFQGHLQLNIRDIHSIAETEINTADFLPHSSKNIEEMYQELLQICRQELKNPWVAKLILGLLEDETLAPQFKRVPAAKSNHHAWVGGLLEHVLQLVKLGRDTLKHYPRVNPDLVLAGLILHDFGKVEELSAERNFEYTDKGQLVGHLVIGVELILKQAAKIPNFPNKVLYQLQHIILSHHGHLEYGSPKEPMTLEALMVHHLDNMDSKLQGFLDTVARETSGDPKWTGSSFLFKRPLYKKAWEDLGETPADPLSPKLSKEDVAALHKGPKAQDKPTYAPKPKPHPKHEDKKYPPKNNHQDKPNIKHISKAEAKKPLKTSLGDLLSAQMSEKNTETQKAKSN